MAVQELAHGIRVAGVAGNLATAYTILGSTELINKEIDHYLSLTVEDLKRAAQTYFVPKNRVVLHYLPLSAKPQ